MPCTARVLVGSILMLIGSTAQATVIWQGNFQTGNLSQWSGQEVANTTDLQVVTTPVPSGDTYAMEVTLHSGDTVDDGNRAEVDYTGDEPAEGDVRYYHWQTYFPSDFDSADTWQLFTQWHHTGDDGSPPLQILAEGDQIRLDNSVAVPYWSTPLVLGTWHDFIVHVVWSSDASTGGVEVWYDGEHVLSFTNGATLFSGMSVYLKQGLYRNSDVGYTQVLYHCGMTIATELSDVMPSGATDAGTSAPADAGSVHTEDAGSPVEDAGEPRVDAGSGSRDAGPSREPDAGEPVADAGTIETGGDDAGPERHDAGSAPADAGHPGEGESPDAGRTVDAGHEDAGSVDAGSVDAGDGASDGSGSGLRFPGHHLSCESTGDPWMVSNLFAMAWLLRRKRRPPSSGV